MEQRTKIIRSKGATIGSSIFAAVALGISVWLFVRIAEGRYKPGFAVVIGIGAVLLLLAGLFLIFMSINAGSAACPTCGERLSWLGTKSNDGVLCSNCRTYLEGSSGELWRTDENRVADKPIFCSSLPETPVFPGVCCVCGQANVHMDKITSLMGNTRGSFNRWVTVYVPHCIEHEDGAKLGGDQDDPYIKFCSLPYLRSFCRMNGTEPGRYRRAKG
jgi:hypothetical protein